MILKQRIARLL